MIVDSLSTGLIWNSYINSFIIPIIFVLLIIVIAGIILNHALNMLYYIFIESVNSKRLTPKKIKVCKFCSCKSTYNDLHDTLK